MKIKPPFYNNWRAFFNQLGELMAIILAFTGIIGLIYFTSVRQSDPVRDIKATRYQGETVGIITSAQPHTGMKQNRYGTRITTDYFIVTYQYQVGDSVYNGSDQLRNTPVLAREVARLRGNGFRDSVAVRYDKKEVQNSVVEI